MRSQLVTGALIVLVVAAAWAAPASVLAQATAPDTSGMQIDGEYGPHLPPAVYEHDYAKKGDLLINVLHWFMFALFGGWGIFFVYCLFRFRARPGHQATSTLIKAKFSKSLEVAICIFEAVLLLGLSIPAWAEVKNEAPGEDENPLHVRVVAEQFAWNFHYAGPDGVFGRSGPQHIDDAENPLGLDPDDPNGEDDVTAAELHIPVHRPVIAEVTSKDVIHSFFLPVLRVKQDVIPGMRIPTWFQAGRTGTYEVACAQLCGNNHYSMRAIMVIEEENEFAAWLEAQVPVIFDEDDLD